MLTQWNKRHIIFHWAILMLCSNNGSFQVRKLYFTRLFYYSYSSNNVIAANWNKRTYRIYWQKLKYYKSKFWTMNFYYQCVGTNQVHIIISNNIRHHRFQFSFNDVYLKRFYMMFGSFTLKSYCSNAQQRKHTIL